MLLYHPFTEDPGILLGNNLDWTAAYQSDCLDKHHNHDLDSLPNYVEDDDDDDDDSNSDSESIPDEDRDAENWRAEWMQEAGRRPNQHVEVDFSNL